MVGNGEKVVVFGDELGLITLQEAIPDMPVCAVVYSCRRQEAEPTALKLAQHYDCDVLMQPLYHQEGYGQFVDILRHLRPSVGLCCSYDIIMPSTLLELFPKGIFNVHGALLPKYRGANVLNWAIINGEKETGVTLHKMVEKLDAGPLLLQKRVPIYFHDTACSLRDRMRVKVVEILREAWPLLNLKTIPLTEQREQDATYVRRRTPEDGLIDWNKPAEEIYNLIRALVKPWPGAWYRENGDKVVIDEYLTLKDVISIQKRLTG